MTLGKAGLAKKKKVDLYLAELLEKNGFLTTLLIL